MAAQELPSVGCGSPMSIECQALAQRQRPKLTGS
jgi:hypothetical protein